MKFIRAIYSGYAVIIFSLLFILLFPFFLIPIIDKRRYNWTGVLNRIWAWLFFIFLFIRIKVEYEEELEPGRQYVFCPNHFSYLDIPTMGLINRNTIFVGKSSIEKVPLFGWMYKRLHITVDRESLRSKYSTFLLSMDALKEGKNLVIFPEGGIITKNPPQMTRFKEGAFKVALNTGTPIVPVSIVNNWKILPENLLLRNKMMKMIVHKPIETRNLSEEDFVNVKNDTFDAIQTKLNIGNGD